MSSSPSPLPSLFTQIPDVFTEKYDVLRPWDLLGAPLDQVLHDLPVESLLSPILPGVHLSGEHIVVGKGVRIAPGVTLQGPLFIGEDSDIRAGAFLREGVWIGRGCIVGANTEVKRGILFPGARAPHLNYVGDSILGAKVNLGAGTILSNFRHDGGGIGIPTPQGRLHTGRRKLGAILGDGVNTGCNCVLHPGTIVGQGTSLYPGVHLRSGIVPEDILVKLKQDLQFVPLKP